MNTSLGTEHGGPKVIEFNRCKLVVLTGASRSQEIVVNRERFRIGKSDDCDLTLKDETVSRNHCELVQEPKGYLLKDLGSTNGTLLDGAEIREAYLKPGAIITVGKVELKVRPFSERIELLPSENTQFGQVVGATLPMREIFGLMERLAPSEATILITGETGTGKDVLARSVHAASPRAARPFLVVDCGAVVGSLIESELFGHEKGSFTGATRQRQGAFELAAGGTLFLDEIGELPLDLQPKLLRVLEQRSFRRVGGNRELRADVRIVAATKRNLRLEVERGKFREDLFFRLAVVSLEMPSLRDRREDIPLLVETLVDEFSRKMKQEGRATDFRVSPSLLGALSAHDWPGNVRELRNVLERSIYLAQATGTKELAAAGLFADAAAAPAGPQFSAELSYRDTKAEWEADFERRYVRWLLDRNEGNISRAARQADMDRKYLHKLAKKHGVHPTDQKGD